jgi:hypothetical protein
MARMKLASSMEGSASSKWAGKRLAASRWPQPSSRWQRSLPAFVHPPTAAGPIGLFGVRYECPSLRRLLGTGNFAWTGSVQVLFQTSGLLEPTVMRASITVGEIASGR